MLKSLENTAGYRAWNAVDPDKNDWISYQAHLARADHAIYLAEFFWPTFEDNNGLLLRRNPFSRGSKFDPNKYSSLTDAQIEYIVNHLHVSDLFWSDPERGKYDPSVYMHLANVMAQMWRARLAVLFPNLSVVVAVANVESDPEVYAQKVRQ
jgi:hypothetical protein